MGISNRKRQLKKQAHEMSVKNTKRRVLRERLEVKKNKKSRIFQNKNVKEVSKPRPPPSATTINALSEKQAKNRELKLKRIIKLQKTKLDKSKKRIKSVVRNSTDSASSQALYSPQSSLRIMREVGISKSGNEKLRRRASQQGKTHLLASRRKIEFARKDLEEGMEYILDRDFIRLKSLSTSISKRLKNLNSNMKKKALLSVDKGQGRVLVTLAFPYRHEHRSLSRPNSDTNHLILATWEGEDKYEALKSRISSIYPTLSEELKLQILLGGDLAFLCSNYGCHPSMTQPCIWCSHAFDKSMNSEKKLIPFEPKEERSNRKKKKAIPRKDPIWKVDLENVCKHCPNILNSAFQVVPPVLHIKLKIGNDLFQLLRIAAEEGSKKDELDAILVKCGLNKDRRSERKIYSELNGEDVKKFSKSWEKFDGICLDTKYKEVIYALSAFDKWSKLASTVDLHLSDEHLQSLCCKENHSSDDCCATSALVKRLEILGGFGNSVKIHVMAQHVGNFAWRHRILGAVSEEGIERLHRTFKDDIQNISRHDDIERALLVLKRWTVQVQLADLEKCVD